MNRLFLLTSLVLALGLAEVYSSTREPLIEPVESHAQAPEPQAQRGATHHPTDPPSAKNLPESAKLARDDRAQVRRVRFERMAAINALKITQDRETEEFLRGELKFSDEEVAVYRKMRQRHEEQIKERGKQHIRNLSSAGPVLRPESNAAAREYSEITKLFGWHRFERYQEFRRRQGDELKVRFDELREYRR